MMQKILFKYFKREHDAAHEVALVVCAEGADPGEAARRALCEAEQMAEKALALTHAYIGSGQQREQSDVSTDHVAVKRMKDVVRMKLPDGNHFVALCAKVRVSTAGGDKEQNWQGAEYRQTVKKTFKHVVHQQGQTVDNHASSMPLAMIRYCHEQKKNNEERVLQRLMEVNRKVLPAALTPELYCCSFFWGG